MPKKKPESLPLFAPVLTEEERQLKAEYFAALHECAAAIWRAEQEIKAWSMLYQGELKIRVAKHNGVSFQRYKHMPYEEWREIRTRYIAETGESS